MSRLRGEEGISLLVAIASMAIMVLLGSVAVQQAVTSLHRAARDEGVKTSLHAADAAVDAAIYQLNRLDLGGALNVDPLDPGSINGETCVASTAEGFDLAGLSPTTPQDAQGRRWCPVVEETSGATTWQYRVSQLARLATGACDGTGTISLARDIVAVGRGREGTVRRVHARLRAPVSLLSGAAVQSASTTAPLTLSGSARVLGDVHANHDIRNLGGTPVVSGDALPGPGTPAHEVVGFVPLGASTARCHRLALPPVDQGDARTNNDNGQWTWDCLTLSLLPTSCNPPLLPASGGVVWNAGHRTLRVWGNARIALTGDTYSFCHIRLENQAILQIPASVAVSRLFLDDPGECKDSAGNQIAGAGQIVADGQSRIVNCHPQTQPESLQVYAVGSADEATTQTLSGAAPLTSSLMGTLCGLALPEAGTPMTVYAPRSRVQIEGSTGISGQVAADTVHLGGLAAVEPVNALINLNALGSNPVLPLYQPDEYVECRAVTFDRLPENDPTQGC